MLLGFLLLGLALGTGLGCAATAAADGAQSLAFLAWMESWIFSVGGCAMYAMFWWEEWI
jgi:hypothetical protein